MTTEWHCLNGDFESSLSKIDYFQVTEEKGVGVEILQKVEYSVFGSLWSAHLRSHPGHTAELSFSVPEGHIVRDNIIYKSPET